eukprot:CAMPEP_0197901370 /NCGR_PEP_ID=MMETSP1439-20131203/50969_1 /TAXON_ID=66791 /ORGANISM="Gonyaulax spinifera, Strain CCMP409" /LENGTH=221 /DNA_ID=CAMNT_0043522335 /DNA_START=56 /DNA_END=719 /DNA_ORIENTATION=-
MAATVMAEPQEMGVALPSVCGAGCGKDTKETALGRNGARWQRGASDASTEAGLSDDLDSCLVQSEQSDDEYAAPAAEAACHAGSSVAVQEVDLEDGSAALAVFALLLTLAAALSWCFLPAVVAAAILGLALAIVVPCVLLPSGAVRVAAVATLLPIYVLSCIAVLALQAPTFEVGGHTLAERSLAGATALALSGSPFKAHASVQVYSGPSSSELRATNESL